VTAESVEPMPLAAIVRRRRARVRPTLVVSIVMLATVLATVIVFPFLPGFDPFHQELSNAMVPPFRDAAHLLGTDPLGRDVLSRLALAGRISLLIVVAVVAINLVIGVVLGLIAGYFGGPLDNVVMGVADVQLAMPFVLLLIAVSAVIGPSTALMIVMLGITFWVGYGRVARGLAMSLREREFVLAPITQGAGSLWILRKHLLPAVIPQLAIIASFDVGLIVIAQASLDFLGLGVQPPTPTWGGMIAEGQKYLQVNPWLCVVPGVVMFLLIGGVQFLSQQFTAESGPAVRGRG
jgi:peptide/nickel transport system permease protein